MNTKIARHHRTTLLAAALLLAALPALAAVDTFQADKVHSEASFQVRHMVVSKVRGRFNDFACTVKWDRTKLESSSVEFTIKTASVNTGNDKRDGHLRSADFFDAEKFPELTFKSKEIKSTGKDSYAVTGTLTMHGVSKEITLPVTYGGEVKDPGGNTKVGFETTTTLNRRDYGVNWNHSIDNGGVVVSDDVVVTVSLEMVKEALAPAAAPTK